MPCRFPGLRVPFPLKPLIELPNVVQRSEHRQSRDINVVKSVTSPKRGEAPPQQRVFEQRVRAGGHVGAMSCKRMPSYNAARLVLLKLAPERCRSSAHSSSPSSPTCGGRCTECGRLVKNNLRAAVHGAVEVFMESVGVLRHLPGA